VLANVVDHGCGVTRPVIGHWAGLAVGGQEQHGGVALHLEACRYLVSCGIHGSDHYVGILHHGDRQHDMVGGDNLSDR
jgi:hypothetical protein